MPQHFCDTSLARMGVPPLLQRIRDEEPFITIRAHPWRFGLGFPAVFIVSIGASLPFVFRSLSLAIAIQLGLQTAGLLWLYLPVALRRWRAADEGGEDRGNARGADGVD